jgi:hypothetical protein
MTNPHAEKILASFAEPDFAHFLADRFEVLECIGDSVLSEVYLLTEKNTATLYVLKIQRDLKTAVNNEAEMLRGLDHPGLPKYEDMTEQDGVRYSLRKFIQGEPLSKFESLPMDTAAAVHILLKLCDILEYLHTQPKPVIHRDIKPSNIIYNRQTGTLMLIDFAISRRYIEGSKNDTVYFLTQQFAPPEQHGYAQTDARSDVFSAGMLLRFLLTGSAEREATITDKGLAKIVEKSTSFAPESRYQSALALRQALTIYINRTARRVRFYVTGIFALCFILAVVWAAVRWPQAVHYPLHAETIDVQLMVDDFGGAGAIAGEVVTISGNGTYTARIEFDGVHRGFLSIGILGAGGQLGRYPYPMRYASLAPQRFRSASIVYDSVIINDRYSLEVNAHNQRLVMEGWYPAAGYAFTLIWNGWYPPGRYLSGVEVVPIEYTAADMFTVPGVSAIYSIEITFTITGVRD